MMMRHFKLAIGAAAVATVAALAGSAPVYAQAAVMKECGAEYQAAKTAGSLNGQSWTGYLADCRVRKANAAAPVAPAPAPIVVAPVAPKPPVAAAPAPAPVAPPIAKVTPPAAPAPLPPLVATPAPGAAPATPVAPGKTAEVSRERQCGAYWRANKVALVAQTPGLKWPQYWSKCNTELKAAGK